MIRIAIADDHAMFREGIRNLLATDEGFEVVGEAGTGREALNICRELDPSVLLLDIDLPEMDGIDVTRSVRDEGLHVRIIILTMHASEEYAVRLIRAGAMGFIPKYLSGQILPGAIRAVMGGKTFIPDDMREKVLARLLDASRSELERLSDRELQVFKLLAIGNTIHEIAEALGISPRTVETHKSRIMDKMGLKNIAELVRMAIRLEIVKNY
jgi:DNA-binding NarL/FixJ family response regulator